MVNLKFQATEAAPQLRGPAENVPSTSQGLSLPVPVPQSDAPLDLEQQWQDIMAIMELQVCIVCTFFMRLWHNSWLKVDEITQYLSLTPPLGNGCEY